MNVTASLLAALEPGRATTTRLLGYLLEVGTEQSLADIARALDLSSATVMREVDRLVGAGVLREQRLDREEGRRRRERLVAIDEAAPHYGPLRDLLFVTLGARPGLRGELAALSGRRSDIYGVDDLDVGDHMPRQLRSDRWGAEELPGEMYDGPPLPVARGWLLRLQPLAGRARAVEGRLQEAYRRWRVERDRDLIHLTLHAGAGSWQAIKVLGAVTERSAHNFDRSTSDMVVGRLAWAHAVYAVNAEALICQGIADHLETVLEEMNSYSQLQSRFREKQALLQTAHQEQDSEFAKSYEREVLSLRAQLVAAERALEGRYHYGGLSALESIGTAGERLIAVEGQRVAVEAARAAGEMAEHPSFVAWQRENPEVLESHPLAAALNS